MHVDLQKLIRNNSYKAIDESLRQQIYTMRDVAIPEVWHFLYKSRSTTQLTSPGYTAPYSKPEERARLFAVYQSIHDRMHNAARPLKTLFHVGKFEAILGWVGVNCML
jgi:vacuolar fusion protein MON1